MWSSLEIPLKRSSLSRLQAVCRVHSRETMLRGIAFVWFFALAACGMSMERYLQFRDEAVAQGRPAGQWVSSVCRVEDFQACIRLCAGQRNQDACNNLAVMNELQMNGAAGAAATAELYRVPCMFGSEGACYNRKRLEALAQGLEAASPSGFERPVVPPPPPPPPPAVAERPARPTVSGQIVLEGREAFTAPVHFCASGESRGFFGVDLSSADGTVLRVVSDPIEGTRARLARPGKSALVMERKSCPLLLANIQKTGGSVDGLANLEGMVALECKGEHGTRLSAEVTFSDCHLPASDDAR